VNITTRLMKLNTNPIRRHLATPRLSIIYMRSSIVEIEILIKSKLNCIVKNLCLNCQSLICPIWTALLLSQLPRLQENNNCDPNSKQNPYYLHRPIYYTNFQTSNHTYRLHINLTPECLTLCTNFLLSFNTQISSHNFSHCREEACHTLQWFYRRF